MSCNSSAPATAKTRDSPKTCSTLTRSTSSLTCKPICRGALNVRKIPIRQDRSPGPPGPLLALADGKVTARPRDRQDRLSCGAVSRPSKKFAAVTPSQDLCIDEPARGERLSWLSSGLPWPIVSDDGIEDCQQLSGDCDECDHLWFAGSDKTLVERLQDWIVPRGNRRAHEQRGSHDGTTAANEAFAAPFAGLASKGSEASKRRNLPAAELPELG